MDLNEPGWGSHKDPPFKEILKEIFKKGFELWKTSKPWRQDELGCTTGQSVSLEGTPGPHHEEDTVSPSLKEEKREKKEPEGEIAVGVEDEDQLPEEETQAAAADTAPGDTAPQAENQTTEISVPSHAPEQPGAAKQPAPTAKQLACPHPFAQVVTLTGGITICNHCFGLVAFDPLADAA